MEIPVIRDELRGFLCLDRRIDPTPLHDSCSYDEV